MTGSELAKQIKEKAGDLEVLDCRINTKNPLGYGYDHWLLVDLVDGEQLVKLRRPLEQRPRQE